MATLENVRSQWWWHAARGARRGVHQAHDLYRLIRATPDWRAVWGARRNGGGHALPPLRLRNGLVIEHGPLDNPLLLLDEVFVNRWYGVDAVPPAGAVMVDIGANIGGVSLFWAQSSPGLRIHAYEPNPSAHRMLERNVGNNRLLGRVETFPEAVGRQDGELDLWVDVPSELSTAYLEEPPVEGGRRIAVPMIGLDELWERLDRRPIWLLKIDTEGAEADTLEGASPDVLCATQNAIVEYHDNICPEASTTCRRVLQAAGFDLRWRVHPWDEGIIYATRG
jgi:FkbM family methyltransferase